MNKPVLCLGDVCMDLIIPYADALRAKAGESLAASAAEVFETPGGSVANTACAIARLGVPVCFAGTCGKDSFGDALKRSLLNEGVDVTLLRTDETLPTQLVLLVLNDKGDRTAFACPAHGGSQHAIVIEQLPDDLPERIGWLHVSGMMLREDPAARTQIDFMRRCYERGIPVSLDINARIESLHDAFFYQNLMEAKQYASVVFGSALDEIPLLAAEHDAETAALLLSRQDKIIIARSGDQGAVFYRNGQRVHYPAFAVPVADTVGAGDTFDGAYIASRMRGLGRDAAVRCANAAAAICVSKPGGRSAPTLAELQAFLNERSQCDDPNGRSL